MRAHALSVIAFLSFTATLKATPITFDFENDAALQAALQNQAVGSYMVGGLNATFATASASQLMNGIASGGLGIDDASSGTDNAVQIDGVSESLTISFDQDVELTFLGVANVDVTFVPFFSVEQYSLSINGTNSVHSGDASFAAPPTLLAGQTMLMSAVGSTAFGFRNVQVNTLASSSGGSSSSFATVPEPSSLALGCLALGGLGIVVRRRNRAD